jgi:hypothetical protein
MLSACALISDGSIAEREDDSIRYLNRRYQDKGRRRVKIKAAYILLRDATR